MTITAITFDERGTLLTIQGMFEGITLLLPKYMTLMAMEKHVSELDQLYC